MHPSPYSSGHAVISAPQPTPPRPAGLSGLTEFPLCFNSPTARSAVHETNVCNTRWAFIPKYQIHLNSFHLPSFTEEETDTEAEEVVQTTQVAGK